MIDVQVLHGASGTLLLIARVCAFFVGLDIVRRTVLSAVQTFIVPRGISVKAARVVFLTTRRLFDLWGKRHRTYAERDAIMAFYAPLSLLALTAVWLITVVIGYTFMFWGLGLAPTEAFTVSGSSFFTLGFARGPTTIDTILSFSEAGFGLLLVALLISYLPAMFTAWSRREVAVDRLTTRAGSPPSPVEMIIRMHVIGSLSNLGSIWNEWEDWFLDLEESHTSLAALSFFRSSLPDRHWMASAGCILDFAALCASTLDRPREGRAELTIRTGYLALRRIATLFYIPFDPNPAPDDPISITRTQFDLAYDKMRKVGVPLRQDREQCWRDFAGWRVNYDAVLRGLWELTVGPPASWIDKLGTDHYLDIAAIMRTGHDPEEDREAVAAAKR